MRRAGLAAIFTLLAGCTTIEHMVVQTTAVNCDITRGGDQDGNGTAEADVVSRSGAVAAAFARSLHSVVDCPDGTRAEAMTTGAGQAP